MNQDARPWFAYRTAVARTIAATSFSGYVGQEFTPKGEPIAALEEVYDICNV